MVVDGGGCSYCIEICTQEEKESNNARGECCLSSVREGGKNGFDLRPSFNFVLALRLSCGQGSRLNNYCHGEITSWRELSLI
jgi:hypothetical protein